MTATYAGTGQLSVVPGEGMSDVVDGNKLSFLDTFWQSDDNDYSQYKAGS